MTPRPYARAVYNTETIIEGCAKNSYAVSVMLDYIKAVQEEQERTRAR